MANDQEMKLKSQKHYNASLDKSLRPPVSVLPCRKKRKPRKSVPGCSASSSSSSSAPPSSNSSAWLTLPLTTSSSDLLVLINTALPAPTLPSLPHASMHPRPQPGPIAVVSENRSAAPFLLRTVLAQWVDLGVVAYLDSGRGLSYLAALDPPDNAAG